MKKIIVVVFCLALSFSSFSQMFNTGQTLKEKTFAVGINPIFFESGDDYKFGVYVNGGYGITQGIDVNVKYGWLDETNYLGADLEFTINRSVPYISLTAGGHLIGAELDNFGIDLGGNITFPVSSKVDLFGAVDTDIDFVKVYRNGQEENETYTRVWIPLGLEFKLSSAAIILEADIAVSDHAYNIFGGGFIWYFK